jgi:hypothetical protein
LILIGQPVACLKLLKTIFILVGNFSISLEQLIAHLTAYGIHKIARSDRDGGQVVFGALSVKQVKSCAEEGERT